MTNLNTSNIFMDENLKEGQQFLTGSAGKAGEYSVNVRTGTLSFKKHLFTLPGNLMPIDLSISFNQNESYHSKAVTFDTFLPVGWKFNYQQFICNHNGNLYYIDADYSIRYFKPIAQNVYIDSSGSGLILKSLPQTNGTTNYTLTDGKNLVYTFTDGYLTEISKRTSLDTYVKTTITYNTDTSLNEIIDGMGNVIRFTYGSNYPTKLITITRPDGKTVTLGYSVSSQTLTSIVDIDSLTYYFSFMSLPQIEGYLLTENSTFRGNVPYDIVSEQGEKAIFTYDDIRSRVSQITHYVNDNVTGCHELTYESYRTLVRSASYSNTASDADAVAYEFNSLGEVKTVYTLNNQGYNTLQADVSGDFFRKTISVNNTPSAVFKFSLRNFILDSVSLPFGEINSLDITDFTKDSSKEYVFSAMLDCVADSSLQLFVNDSTTPIATLTSDSTKLGKRMLFTTVELPDTIRKLKVKANVSGTATISDVKLTRQQKTENNSCIAQPTANNTEYISYDLSSTIMRWYQLENCSIINKITKATLLSNVKITIKDLTLSKRDFFTNRIINNDFSYNVWYNNGKDCLCNVTDILFAFGDNHYGIEEIDFAEIQKSYFLQDTLLSTQTVVNATYFDADRIILSTTKLENSLALDSYKSIDVYDRVISETDQLKNSVYYMYDNFGNLISIKNKTGSEYNLANSYNLKNYSADGKHLLDEANFVDDSKIVTSYSYDANNRLSNVTSPTGCECQYVYNNDNVTKISFENTNGSVLATNNLIYNNKNQVSYLYNNQVMHGITYNPYNNIGGVFYNNSSSPRYSVGFSPTEAGATVSVVGSSTIQSYQFLNYDKYGRVIKSGKDAQTIDLINIYCDNDTYDLTNVTNPNDPILKINANSPLRKRIVSGEVEYFYYDEDGKLADYKSSNKDYVVKGDKKRLNRSFTFYDKDGAASFYLSYNNYLGDLSKLNNSTDYSEFLKSILFSTSDQTTLNDLVEYKRFIRDVKKDVHNSIIYESVACVTPTDYDGYNVITSSTPQFNRTLTYDSSGIATGSFTGKVTKVSYYNSYFPGENLYDTYTYDKYGNISSHGNQTGVTENFYYDELNRIKRYDDVKAGRSYLYYYDITGNLTNKNTHLYGGNTYTSCIKQEVFTYDNQAKGQILSVGGLTCQYDSYGNPIKYKGNDLSWDKINQLKQYDSTTFTYNGLGQIVQKNTTGSSFKKSYDNEGRLIKESISIGNVTRNIVYIYAGKEIIGFAVSNSENGKLIPYTYQKNILGDVIAIYDSSGKRIVSYSYDPWGNYNISVDESVANLKDEYEEIANLNPIRYRGYYYDTDLGLYNINGRYYDPETGRFISPADINTLDPQRADGLNLYAYAHNNPMANVYNASSDGGMASTLNSNINMKCSSLQVNTSSNGSSFRKGLYGEINSMFNLADAVMSYGGGVLDGLLSLLGSPRFDKFQSKLSKASKWMAGIGLGLDILSSAINNYNNDNLTSGQKWASFGADVGYYVAKAGLSYGAGSLLTSGAVALGVVAESAAIAYLGVGFLGASLIAGGIVAVAIIGGTILITVLSDALDNWWEKKKKEWFN